MSIELLNIDCMDYMKDLPDNAFDLAIVDPPYGIDVNSMNMGGRKTVQPTKKDWDKSIPEDIYFRELFRVSKNQVIWGGNYFELPQSQYFAIWDKGGTMYGRDFAECEYAWISKGGTRIFKLSPNQLDRFHPTQKPVKLYQWLLDKYAKPGDKILDTHLGSASSAIAAHYAGYDFVGMEIDKHYYDLACKRFKKDTAQIDMFGGTA
jgi:site-specific DNA-methyltransferase (adenine-specific)